MGSSVFFGTPCFDSPVNPYTWEYHYGKWDGFSHVNQIIEWRCQLPTGMTVLVDTINIVVIAQTDTHADQTVFYRQTDIHGHKTVSY